jgi:hypothetical protein
MEGIDLSGVDPVRLPEIRRRIMVLDEYVALHRPDADLRKAYAARIGISVSQLYHLARVWRTSRSAESIPGARSRFAVPRPRRVDPGAIRIAQATIDHLGATTARRSILAEVARRCTEASVDAPSDSTVTNMLSAARSAMARPIGLDPEILVDELTVRLPVLDGRDVIMPRVLVAVVLPQRRIVATDMACTRTSAPSFMALMRALEAASSTAGVRLPVRAPHVGGESDAVTRGKNVRDRDHRPKLSQVMGNRLGQLGILYRPNMARPASELAAARHASPLHEADARRIILEATAEHNRSVEELPAAGFAISGSVTG